MTKLKALHFTHLHHDVATPASRNPEMEKK